MRSPTIFYYCYSHNRPTGGQKHTYQHVDVLNRHGFNATVFHPTDNMRLTWFDNRTPVIGISEFKAIHRRDVDFIVVPEDLGLRIADFPGKKVIFNKNLFYGFASLPWLGRVDYGRITEDVVALLTVSEHNLKHLQYAYPHHLIRLVHPAIRQDIFSWRSLETKRPQIACISKNPEWLATLYHTIQCRASLGLNRGDAFTWRLLESQTETEVAEVLQDSLICVFLSITEGQARLPLEAMSCGCLVTAWRCGPLKETLPECLQFEFGSLLDMVRFIEEVMEAFPTRLSVFRPIAEASKINALAFSVERQEKSVIAAWEAILKSANRVM